MKNLFFYLFIAAFSFASCSDDDDKSSQNIDGNYIGTFERNGTIANVEITLNNGNFVGNSQTEKFPAICKGTFDENSNEIVFLNDCLYTADFDWTLILNENWTYTFSNNVLTLNKSNGDQYILQKQ